MATPAEGAAASPLRVRDMVPAFLAYASRAVAAPRGRWADLWRTHYLAPHRDLYAELDRRGDWSGTADLESVLARLHGREAVFAARTGWCGSCVGGTRCARSRPGTSTGGATRCGGACSPCVRRPERAGRGRERGIGRPGTRRG